MLIMAYAHARLTGDGSLIHSHVSVHYAYISSASWSDIVYAVQPHEALG